MGQTTLEIEDHIEDTRQDLGSNLHELEQRVKAVADWRGHFQTRPMTMLGVAFGGGILLAKMLGGRKNGAREQRSPRPVNGSRHAAGTWQDIKGALAGAAATRFKKFIGDVVPGFDEQLQRTEERATAFRPPAW